MYGHEYLDDGSNVVVDVVKLERWNEEFWLVHTFFTQNHYAYKLPKNGYTGKDPKAFNEME